MISAEFESIDKQIESALDNTAPWAIHAIRVDERRRLAKLLEEDATTIGGFIAADAESAVKAVAFMIGLENRP